jgi:hypothetical protein
MSAIEVLLAVAGFTVTALVVAGMILLTPRGQVPVHTDGEDPEGSQLSAATAPRSVPTTPGRFADTEAVR